jgi:hypothetical protein
LRYLMAALIGIVIIQMRRSGCPSYRLNLDLLARCSRLHLCFHSALVSGPCPPTV